MPRKQTKKRSVKARSPVMTRSRTRKAAAAAAAKPRKRGFVTIITNRSGDKGQVGQVAGLSGDGKRVGLVLNYNGMFVVKGVEEVRKSTDAEKKNPRNKKTHSKELTLDSYNKRLLNP